MDNASHFANEQKLHDVQQFKLQAILSSILVG